MRRISASTVIESPGRPLEVRRDSMQPEFVSDALVVWGNTPCHHCHHVFSASRAQITSSAPRIGATGDMEWIVHVVCPKCHGTVGLLLSCKIVWPQVRQ